MKHFFPRDILELRIRFYYSIIYSINGEVIYTNLKGNTNEMQKRYIINCKILEYHLRRVHALSNRD